MQATEDRLNLASMKKQACKYKFQQKFRIWTDKSTFAIYYSHLDCASIWIDKCNQFKQGHHKLMVTKKQGLGSQCQLTYF